MSEKTPLGVLLARRAHAAPGRPAISCGTVTRTRAELEAICETCRRHDLWLVCARGASVAQGEKVPCSEPHTWRAVTTIKVGRDEDPYPGERLVEVRTRDFCSDSVGAWLGYPVDYDFGYTYFHEAEWKAGNRRSICWAKTEK